MSKHEILNNVDHKNLRVLTQPSAYPGNNIMCVLAMPSEFRDLQAEYPIFLHKDEASGRFLPMAMLGLEKNENLYLGDKGWNAAYLPLMIARGPFLIGFQESGSGTERQKKMVISIDVDDSRVSESAGEPLFQPFGGNSNYTDHIAEVLQRIDQGQAEIQQFCEALQRHDLIEPFSLDIKLDNDVQHKMEGFYTLNEEKLAALDGDTLSEFSRAGILQAAYMILASFSSIRNLVNFKNARV
ncbi:MAG: SapC family protein [Halioglobus sp.]